MVWTGEKKWKRVEKVQKMAEQAADCLMRWNRQHWTGEDCHLGGQIGDQRSEKHADERGDGHFEELLKYGIS